jgi:hypothetical protein
MVVTPCGLLQNQFRISCSLLDVETSTVMCRTAEDVAENSQYTKSLPAGRKLQMVVTVLDLLYTARSRCPPIAEYSRKSAAADDGLHRTNRALIPNVGDEAH